MAYSKIEQVPANIRKHKGVELSVAQANEWAAIFDAIKDKPGLQNPAGAAWSAWEKVYKTDGGKWVRKERAATEGLSIDCYTGGVKEFVEGIDGLPSEATVVLIKAGPCKTKKRFYDAAALKELAESGMLNNLKQYDKHVPNAEDQKGAIFKDRSCSEFWSVFTKVWWDPLAEEVRATIKLCDRTIKEKLRDAWEHLGISLTSLGESYIGKDGMEHISKIVKVLSADWVPESNAGGRVLQLAEAVAPDTMNDLGKGEPSMDLKDLTMEMLKEQRPDLYEAIINQAKSAMKESSEKEVEAAKAEATKQVGEAKVSEEAAKAESVTVKAQLTEKAKEFAESKVAQSTVKLYVLAEEKCTDLTPLAKMKVIKDLSAKEYADEKALVEAIDTAVGDATKKTVNVRPEIKNAKPTLAADSKAFAESLGISAEEQEKLAMID